MKLRGLTLLLAGLAPAGGCGDDGSGAGAADQRAVDDLAPADLTAAPDLTPAIAWSARSSGTSASLNALWGSSASDIFIVGDAGTILHSADGHTFAAAASPVAVALHGVWGAAAGDVYAVGDGGTIVHYDGDRWSALPSGVTLDLHGIGGSGTGDVYAVGQAGTILHSTDGGASWPPVPALDPPLGATLRQVLAIGMTVWAAGDAGNFVIHTDHFGSWQWILRNISSPENLAAVCATSLDPLGLWSAADDGSLRYSFDGLIWPRQPGAPSSALRGVWGSSNDDVYAVGDGGAVYHLGRLHDPFALEGSGTARRLNAVWGSAAGDVYAVGEGGTVLHRP